MIKVQSDRCCDRFIVSVEGHAGAGPEGSDIVCAAASALAFTLYNAIADMDEHGEVSCFSHSISKGSVQLDFTAKSFAEEKAASIVEAFYSGFALLEEKYPEYVGVC